MRLSHVRSNPIALALPGAAVLAGGALLFLRQRRIAARFERLGGAALETLLDAIDANDPVTGAHVRRVARYALVLADVMGVDSHLCHSIERVALFHDIGKIHSALFDIVHESDRLSPRERSLVATHPERGAAVLAPLRAFYPDLCEGVLSHHERWDGTGYPRALRGAEIPIVARIVAIADSFDAITHQRRYSRGRSAEEGRRALIEGRGTQFDPALLDLFLSPDTFSSVEKAMRAVHSPPGPRRRVGQREEHVPDITFRWRSESLEPLEQDPERTSPRGSRRRRARRTS